MITEHKSTLVSLSFRNPNLRYSYQAKNMVITYGQEL